MKSFRRIALAIAIALASFFTWVPRAVDGSLNRVLEAPSPVSEHAATLHRETFIADLHCDALLWRRGLLTESSRGHVDLPRLQRGNMGLQVFSVVSNSPIKGSKHGIEALDEVTLLVSGDRWPVSTWFSFRERALFEAAELRDAVAQSSGHLRFIKSRSDLEALLDARKTDPSVVGALLSMEGLYPLEGRLENLGVLADAGFRMLGLAHFADDEVAGSLSGAQRGGLTPLGREVVREMEQRRIIVDLAHSSPKTVDDVLAMATRPVVVSHTGVKGTCDRERNLSDDQLRRIGEQSGLVGIGYFSLAVCDATPKGITRAIRHAVQVAGIDHVALGSDFDGAVAIPFDSAHLSQLTEALIADGFTDDNIRQIYGGNALRFFRATLP